MDGSFARVNTTRDTGRGTRSPTGTDASTIPTEHRRIQAVSRMRRPYLTEEDFSRRTTIPASTNDSVAARADTPNPNADSATMSTSHPFPEPSEPESRRRSLRQMRVAELGTTATAVTEEDMRRLTSTSVAGGTAARHSEISPGSHDPSRQLQPASMRANRPAEPTAEDRVRMRAALAENHRQRYRIMAVQMGLDGATVSDVAVLRGLNMREEAEHGPVGFRGLAGAYVQVIARGTWTLGERERIRGEARGVVEREWVMAGPMNVDTEREAMAVAHRRGLEDWAGGEGGRNDDDDGRDDDDDDDERGGDEEMLENDIENENENDPDIDGDEDGWRDLESALSSHYRRRNARNLNLEAERAEVDIMIQRSEADMSGLRRSTERAARRREERITSLIDGTANTGHNFRLRHRASRERILRAMEGFMAERDRRGASVAGSGPGGGLSEVERQEIERRQGQGVQLHRSRRVAEMMRERESRRLAGAGTNFSSTANSKTRNVLEFLSRLRSCDPSNPVEAFALARLLDVDIRPKIHPDRPYNLLTSTATIPPPAYSSLLTPGATFTGSQHAPQDVSGAHLLSRDRDYLRRMVATRNRTRNRSQAHLPIPLPGSIAALVEAERFLGAHGSGDRSSSGISRNLGLEDEEGEDRSGYPTTRVTDTSLPALRRTQTGSGTQARPPDHWPVSVTLHSVDLERMTLMGTMSASHIPDKSASGPTEQKTDAEEDGDRDGEEGSSMRSFFEGEIIDFRNVTLETERYKWEKAKGDEARGTGVGVNMEVDARYWAQIGPFREVLEREDGSESGNMIGEGKGEDGGADQKGDEDRDARLARCLGSKDWIHKVMREWVLMRWKERIFLSPAATSSSSSSATNQNTNTNVNSNAHPLPSSIPTLNRWGLTISGFYYVAMKRDTGALEGLYYDPQSQPYQRLELRLDGGGVRKCFPSVEFGVL